MVWGSVQSSVMSKTLGTEGCDRLYSVRWRLVEGAWGLVDERSAYRYRKKQGYRSVYRQDECESSVPTAGGDR